jgi:hemerythrin
MAIIDWKESFSVGVAELAEHQKEHEAFTEKVFVFNATLARGDTGVLIEITDFLKDWYISHVFGLDQGYKRFFEKKGGP